MEDVDERYMRMALRLAEKARGRTSPNPMVGAVVVKKGKVVASGYHHRAGDPHAEALALAKAGKAAAGATLYVTLEPCSHMNKRTPPCAPLVASSGVKRVVIAMRDPNPQVAGGGVRAIRKAGIVVEAGVLEAEARKLNEAYLKYITTGLPFVTLKIAQTLDGKIATSRGESKWITGADARKEGHRLRDTHDAILVGVNTVTFMLASFSAGLVIYWAWNNTLSVAQQSVIMSRHGAKVELWDNIKALFKGKKKNSDKKKK